MSLMEFFYQSVNSRVEALRKLNVNKGRQLNNYVKRGDRIVIIGEIHDVRQTTSYRDPEIRYKLLNVQVLEGEEQTKKVVAKKQNGKE